MARHRVHVDQPIGNREPNTRKYLCQCSASCEGGSTPKSTLPQSVLDTLNRYEVVGDYHNPEYEEAMMPYYSQFFCRLDPFPDPVMRSMNNLDGNPVPYETIQGPNEFTFIGNLKGWDRVDRLAEIAVPTLVTCGRYDLLGPACAETLRQGIPNCEMQIFENSAHMAHLEESESYLQVMNEFLGGSH